MYTNAAHCIQMYTNVKHRTGMYPNVHKCKCMKKTVVKLTDEQKKLSAALEYGDIGSLCKVLKVSRMTIWKTLNGKRESQCVWNAIQHLVGQRNAKREESISKQLS